MPTRRVVAALAALSALALLGLSSCGDDDASASRAPTGEEASADRCDPSVPDCDDTPGQGDDPAAGVDADQARADAQHLLGLTEGELDELVENGLVDVRVGRRGEETFSLTFDYVVGRNTVELDDTDGDGVFTVTSVTAELPDGPEVFAQ